VGFEKEERFIVLANWKMHKTRGQNVEYVNVLNQAVQDAHSGVGVGSDSLDVHRFLKIAVS